ncbi:MULTISPECIES: IclR family transcriptional regulator [Actinoalloteichus]|uniref:Transcriptional regulator, IclR family n=2 Tax=Actinoalloteichus cyanogriseus TaxID=2893586 RepID=A0ABT1JNN7_ACTCY|nr:IclR family transcriptional regulator [Actinoalloteichus caeruleus]MCP2334143.1 transcriptional regulator, IclR family [Actinoalloteichus caeruleus DSM 43889]
MSSSSRAPSGVLQTADRALLVLAAFTEREPEHGVSDLARRLDLDKSQVQRLMATLARRDFLVADPRTRRYRLGPALVGLGRLAERGDGISTVVRPILLDLSETTGESTVFNVADGGRYRCSVAVDQPGPFRYTSAVGQLFPGHGGASGHAIFAFYPEEEIPALFAPELEGATDATIGTRAELRRRYAEVRERGYAVSFGEHDARVVGVAAPVFAHGTVLGSVAVVGAAAHLRPQLDAIAERVVAAADALTQRFGSPPGAPQPD